MKALERYGNYSIDKMLQKFNRAKHDDMQKVRMEKSVSFEEMLETEIEKENSIFDALDNMNKQQLEVSENVQKLIIDPDSIDTHDVTISMEKAQMSLSLAQNIVSRICNAWQEISHTSL